MPTIIARQRADGTVGYTAQIRINRGGRLVFSQAQTFDRESAAKAWVKKKEAELAKPGGIEKARVKGTTLANAIDNYIKDSRKTIGKTKAQVLNALRADPIASMECVEIRSEDIVELARRLGETRKAQTVQNYISHLAAIFAVARPAWGMDLDPVTMKDAATAARRLGLVSKSRERDRRPTLDELDRLMAHFLDRHIRGRSLPMHRVVAFAIFSTRRQAEIVSIRWENLEPGRILVRDMKHPGEKIGNDVWCDLPPEAEAIIASMPKTTPEIFPFSTDAVTASFTRACKLLGIEDLHFHDLRHEGASRLFELGKTIPQAAMVTGHRSWASLQRYTHLRHTGDRLKSCGWRTLVGLDPGPEA